MDHLEHSQTEKVLAHHEKRSARRLLLFLALVLLVLLALGVTLVRSLPPRVVQMAAGEVGGAYYAYARRYQEILARHGVRLELLATSGAMDNLARLQDAKSDVSAAILQGGIVAPGEAKGLVSLGTIAYEPVWLLFRGEDLVERAKRGPPQKWAVGKRMSVGPEGSGTRRAAVEMIESMGLERDAVQLLSLPTAAAGEALLRGEIDIVVAVAPFDAPQVQRLLTSPEIQLASFARADAHVALRPYLNKLTLPQGVLDMARNRPPQDVTLVAPKASLVVRQSLHPAVQYLLLQAAVEVHSKPALFQQSGQFPAAEPVDFALSEPAMTYYKSGSPFLQRYLPFWAAALVSELLRVLIPVVAVAYPLLRLAPNIYGWGMRRRIFRLYGELKFIETQLETRASKAGVDDLRSAIERLEARANHMRTPTAFAHMLYTLRLHIRMVRERLERR
jgi:TRAP-type uncharacterized transport system substrate-binding protein